MTNPRLPPRKAPVLEGAESPFTVQWSGFFRKLSEFTQTLGPGTVSSVGLSAPSVFSVGGSPVTTAGTITLGFAGGQPANEFLATPNGGAGALGLRSIVSADLPLATTLAFGAVKPDGSTITIAGGVISAAPGVTGANPTASVGLAAVNGAATTFLRSDGAPKLDVSISPTWTGDHTFTGAFTRSTSVLCASLGLDGGVFPAFSWNNPTGAADAKIWEIYTDASQWHLTLINDAISVARDAITILRAGQATTNIAIGNTTDKPGISLNGPVTIPAPAAGIAFTVTGFSASAVMNIGSGSGAAVSQADLFLTRSGSTANAVLQGPNIELNDGTSATALQTSGGQSELWQFNAGWHQLAFWNSNRQLTFNAPATGSFGVLINGLSTALTLGLQSTGASNVLGLGWAVGIAGGQWNVYTSGTDPITVGTQGAAALSLATNDIARLSISSGGAISGFGPVAGALIDMTPDAQVFTGNFTGFTTAPTATCRWSRNGNQVTLNIGSFGTATSNASTFAMTGLPASIQPAHTQSLPMIPGAFTNNTAAVDAGVTVTAASGTVTFVRSGGAGWANPAVNGLTQPITVSYLLN